LLSVVVAASHRHRRYRLRPREFIFFLPSIDLGFLFFGGCYRLNVWVEIFWFDLNYWLLNGADFVP
jgi:hypothetical protein